MDRYVVTKSFMDRFTRKYYGVGSIYESNDPVRAAELERGGYIAPENTEAANLAIQEQKQVDQNAKEVSKVHSEIQKNAEAKTVLNGKVVPISQAQEAEAMVEMQMKQTGIQQHHNNASEPVQAGQIAKQSNMKSLQQATQQTIRESEMQSGQQAMNQAMNASGSSTQNNFVGSGMQQGYEAQGSQAQGSQAQGSQAQGSQTQGSQNAPVGSGQPGTTAAQMQAEEAAKTAQAAAESKAKAKAKKEH